MWLLDEVAEKMQGGLTLGASVSTLTLCGVPLNEWVYILTIIVLLVQLLRSVCTFVSKIRRSLCLKKKR